MKYDDVVYCSCGWIGWFESCLLIDGIYVCPMCRAKIEEKK